MSIEQLERDSASKSVNDAPMSAPLIDVPTMAAATSAFDDVLLVFSLEDYSLLWLSSAAADLFRNAGHLPGEPTSWLLPDDPVFGELAPVLTDIDGSDDKKAQELTLQGRQFLCRIARLHETQLCIPTIAIRLSEVAPVAADIQDYLIEREKLFTTSRTISVSEMATTLAHEINQPIGSIANILKGARSRLEKTDCDDSIPAALGQALEQTQFASRIIARIRDFTQARQPARIDVQLKDLVVGSIRLLDWVLAKSSTSVELIMPAESIVVNGDATMLQQVFTNLIRNAVDAMIASPVSDRDLTVTLVVEESTVRIEFEDAGHGLSKGAEENLFVPFVTQKAQGMGVGLNICRSFIELHQGRLWLAPNDHGGCTACVVLPVVQPVNPVRQSEDEN